MLAEEIRKQYITKRKKTRNLVNLEGMAGELVDNPKN